MENCLKHPLMEHIGHRGWGGERKRKEKIILEEETIISFKKANLPPIVNFRLNWLLFISNLICTYYIFS